MTDDLGSRVARVALDASASERETTRSLISRGGVETMSMISWVAVLVVGSVVLGIGAVFLIGVYNSVVQLRSNIEKAWNNINVLLQQRHDELIKLVDTCTAYMKHEREVLESVTRLREDYDRAASIGEKTEIENQLNQRLAGLFVQVENYPELKASTNMLEVQKRVSALESNIADRREFFNDSVNIYNIQIARFPEIFVARMLNYERYAFLEVPKEATQDVKMFAAQS